MTQGIMAIHCISFLVTRLRVVMMLAEEIPCLRLINHEISELIPIVRELNLLKKIALHPASHGRNRVFANITSREIAAALDLLRRLEAIKASSNKYFIDIFPL